MAFGPPLTKETTPVQVALRIRPLTSQDRAQPRFSQSTESDVIKAIDNTVVVVPQQKLFTFDHVFGTHSTQEQVFESVASGLVDRFIDGYNVTILAYGQTSSGKTYTMGTEVRDQSDPEHQGIIPRAMAAIFAHLSGKKSMTPSSLLLQAKQRPTSHLPPMRSLTSHKRYMTMVRPPSMITTKPSISTRLSQRAASMAPDGVFQHQQRRYTIKVSFIEIYNEELIDLLNPAPSSERPPVTIREDPKGQIYWTGVREVTVESAEDVLRYLEMGTCNRATGSTDMNAKSSRSHAIFTVTLWQEKWVVTPKSSISTAAHHHHPPPRDTPAPASSQSTVLGVHRRRSSGASAKTMTHEFQHRHPEPTPDDGKWVVSNSKFHFVDLAGSERLKRTAAEGDRRKEGININAGLLALGNVISALADAGGSRRAAAAHIPYRDSKLTRLLQDSLGGNATTLMIACISPSEINLTETVNTVKYAHRARHIKNKVERNEAEEWLTNDNPEFLRGMISKLKDQVRTLRTSNSFMTPPSPRTPSFSTDTSTTPTCSSSATTNITVPDDLDTVVDLRRQIEILQQQVQAKPEIQRSPVGMDFQHLVEPVIEEYEKAVSSLESQLALARAALAHQDQALQAQATELASMQEQQQQQQQQLEREQLESAVAEREATIARLKAAIKEEHILRSMMRQKEKELQEKLKKQECKFQKELKQKDQGLQDAIKRQEQTLRAELQRSEQEAYRWRLHDLEKAQKQVAILQQIQEKQDQIIGGLTRKLDAVETTLFELAERDQRLDALNHALSLLRSDRNTIEEHTQHLVRSLEKHQADTERATAALDDLQKTTQNRVSQMSEELAMAHEAGLAQLRAKHALALGVLQAELEEARRQGKGEGPTTTAGVLEVSHQETAGRPLQDQLSTNRRRLTIDTESSHDSGLPDKDLDDDDADIDSSSRRAAAMLREQFRMSMTTEQVLDKLMQVMAENSQLSVQVNDLESQLELQHNQHTLENEHLELKVMKLSAANERLEKEATSIFLPRSLSSHQLQPDASPPQTPGLPPMFLPLASSSLPLYTQQQQQHRPQARQRQCQRQHPQLSLKQKLGDRDSWPMFRLKKSESQRSMLVGQQRPEDDDNDIIGHMRSTTMIRRVRAQSAAIEAPPSAPPSNPLPPVPSPARSVSTPLLTSSVSRVISNSISGHFSAEQYEKIIRSLQRKVQMADEDVLAHQQVISKLETQLSMSETAVRQVQRQLETVEQEKQTYVLEIEHLRVHEAEHDQQEQQLLQDLARERMLKERAEKARHILERRMEEILCSSKRSKFMCF
ncbi:hypothetical protein BX666DRAFT_2122305 [Dichotomocladium elegans]|nr:hypothetical protein BX666DRAFT_2122305 [Dichotomocladium elegans]